jgi:putative ABC transport system substrate-binding protein
VRRREFITLISGVVAAWPLGTSAQPAKSPIRIGLLPFGSPSNAYDESLVEAFRSGLRQAGLIEGRDIVVQPLLCRCRHRCR